MPGPRIRSDYDQLAQIAQSFQQQHERSMQLLQSLQQTSNLLQSGDWVGQGATAFYQEMNGQVLPTIQRLAVAFEKAQHTTQQIRQLIQQAEGDCARVLRGDGDPANTSAATNAQSATAQAQLAATPIVSGPMDTFGGEKLVRVLDFVTKWGRNASPFNIAHTYLKLNWSGIKYWNEVSKAAKAGHALLDKVDGLEKGATVLKNAVDEQYRAESQLPGYPLQSDDKVGRMTVTPEELDYVDRYYNTAAMIANDAMSARAELDKAIAGWDAAVEQANKTNDFTRKSAWEAITDLDMRFNNKGGSFRAYLVDARDRAARTEQFARMKQWHAAHILGKWTPDGYQPPTP